MVVRAKAETVKMETEKMEQVQMTRVMARVKAVRVKGKILRVTLRCRWRRTVMLQTPPRK
jgi:hypothetical protein